MTDKYERLPKWAQDEILQLKRALQESRDHNMLLEGRQHPSPIYANPYSIAGGPRIYIPKWSTVRFETDCGKIDAQIEIHQKVLRLSANNGMSQIIIAPTAANIIHVRAE